jgi:hypothetical protein
MDKKTDKINSNKISNKPENIDVVNFRGFCNNSEAIVGQIIEKIISFVISEANKNHINREIPKECWNFMTKIINSYLNLEFISKDRDDLAQSNLVNSINKSIQHSERNMLFRDREISIANLGPIEKESDTIDNKYNKKEFDLNRLNTLESAQESEENFDNLPFETSRIDNQNNLNLIYADNINKTASFNHHLEIYFNNKYCGKNSWLMVEEPV